eukprot:m.566360 g.566360  ORF g.566360 m.566360 type:complete len:68 (-) comp22251_c0_seq4:420-623(-)
MHASIGHTHASCEVEVLKIATVSKTGTTCRGHMDTPAEIDIGDYGAMSIDQLGDHIIPHTANNTDIK